MDRTFFVLGAVISGLAVAAGAFGAHALRPVLPPEQMETFETAARYHMYHGLGLLAVAWAADRWPGSNLVRIAGWLLVTGMVLFSGSLYALAITRIRLLGMITPLGGLAFITGWALLAWTAARQKPWK